MFDFKVIMPKDYPEKLLNISNTPKCLYAVGNIELLYKDSFGIVGTRKITEYGKEMCEEFSKEIALRDIPIVSGMAIGVDEVAHRNSLKYYGETIAVLGSGFKNIYPEENKELFKEIVENKGLVLSEYQIDEKKSRDKFPKRNRIIAALSDGILVVEAANKSGSLITARLAKKYGKNVFAIPGRTKDKMSEGTNKIIKNGAILVTEIKDILDYYPQFANRKRKTFFENIKNEDIKKYNLKEEWMEIYLLLKNDEKTLEELQVLTQKNIRDLLKILTEMELNEILIRNKKLKYELI